MRDAVIVEAVRTPVGKRNGALAGVHPVDLSAHVLNALAQRAGLDPAVVDDVIWGCVGQVGEQTFDIARNAVLAAGWPQSVPGVTVDRQCGSSQQSVHFAAAGLVSGQYDVVVAGGVESMSRVPMGASMGPAGANPSGSGLQTVFHGVPPNQGDRRGDDRRALGPVPRPARRVLPRLAREGGRGHRRGPVRRADRAGQAGRRHRGGHRRGRAPRRHARVDGQAQARVQAGRRDPRRATAPRSATARPRC